MNDQQFGGGQGRQPYHAVMGPDGMFRSEPLLPGTVIQTADGVRMWNGTSWDEISGWKLAKRVGQKVDAEVFAALTKPTPEEMAKTVEAVEKALEPKFHFEGF